MKFEFDRTISQNDHMKTATEEAYFRTSLSAYDGISRSISAANKTHDSVKHVLDFGCGYGRVLRVLTAAFPDADIVACDLMPGAVEFCRQQFGAIPLRGNEDLSKIPFDRKYDLIWLGSVFTHLPIKRWKEFLICLEDILAPDGVLVFTSHGRVAMWVFDKHTLEKHKGRLSRGQFEEMKEIYKEDGFAFLSYDQKHLKSLASIGIEVEEQKYGLSFVRPDWLMKLLAEDFENLFLLSYTEGGWGNNHDMISLHKPELQRRV